MVPGYAEFPGLGWRYPAGATEGPEPIVAAEESAPAPIVAVEAATPATG